MEIRGLGIRRLPYEPMAVVRLVVDLGAATERMPQAAAAETEIEGVRLPRLAVARARKAFSLVLAALTFATSPFPRSSDGSSSAETAVRMLPAPVLTTLLATISANERQKRPAGHVRQAQYCAEPEPLRSGLVWS